MLSRGINFSIVYFSHLKEFKIVILLEIILLGLIWWRKLDSLLGSFGIPSTSTYDAHINERGNMTELSSHWLQQSMKTFLLKKSKIKFIENQCFPWRYMMCKISKQDTRFLLKENQYHISFNSVNVSSLAFQCSSLMRDKITCNFL